MPDYGDDQQSSIHDKRWRRRTLLLGLAGAGVPLSQRVLSGQWVAPVVDAVVLPTHAATSPSHATGKFAVTIAIADSSDTDSSLFGNIAERSEEEILDLFVHAAHAVDTCGVSTICSGSYGVLSLEVVATIDENPTNSACVQAKVTLTSCYPNCQMFDFENVAVDGESVSIPGSCEASLTDMTLTEAGLSGQWLYTPTTANDGFRKIGGSFSAPPGNRGCGDLSSCT